MGDSVKQWWPKVAAVAGADTEQPILDLEGLWCVLCSLINLRLNGCWEGRELNWLFAFHIVSHHTCNISGCRLQDKDLRWLTVALSSLKHLKHLSLKGEFKNWSWTWHTHLSRKNCGRSVWFEYMVWCDVLLMCVLWVQTTTLGMRGQRHWVSACHIWHNSPSFTWVVSLQINVLLGVMCVDVCWCVWVQGVTLEMREQRHWVSACYNWHISHILTWVVSVYIDVLLGVCDVWCHIDVICV